MGGKSSPVRQVTDGVVGAAKSGMQIASGGIYDPNTGTFRTGESQLENVGSGISGQTLMNEVSPAKPIMPEAEDPAAQEARVRQQKDKELADLQSKGGLKGTMLGGSESTDPNALKKKKLLGE